MSGFAAADPIGGEALFLSTMSNSGTLERGREFNIGICSETVNPDSISD
jgi:hypothetical protein